MCSVLPAGLSCEGLVPFCAIYSTFLQRGYDQVVHDVALQKLPGGTYSCCPPQKKGQTVMLFAAWRADKYNRLPCHEL